VGQRQEYQRFDEDNNSNNLNNDDVEVAKDINALDESKENETDDNDDLLMSEIIRYMVYVK
jgi:hypothetical protein